MQPLLIPFLSYAFLTVFTPGPNNVSSSAFGSRFGYRRTLPFIIGMSLGMFIILTTAAILSDFLQRNYSTISAYLKWVGAGYMIWLAISLFRSSQKKEGETLKDPSIIGGFLLAILNPKGILFAITVFASFAALLSISLIRSISSALFLTAMMFTACSTWALGGSTLARLFTNPRFAFLFNLAMALFLFYTAYSILIH